MSAEKLKNWGKSVSKSLKNWVKSVFADLKHWIKRAIQAQVIVSRRKMNGTDDKPRSEYEASIFRICKELINKADSELSYDLDYNDDVVKRYVENENDNILIIINDNVIEIINENSFHSHTVSLRTYRRLKVMFTGAVNRLRKKKEEKKRKNVKNSLDIIYNKVKQ